MKKNARRSIEWFGKDGFHHRSWMKNQGLPHHLFDGRPVIGICNTWSELTPCNAHFRVLAERVKRGVYEMGGFPLEFPVMSLGETLMRPSTMLYRNLVSMDVEESIRANPLDGVVLLVGCDKTTPALLMGAASCDLPTTVVSGGPMLNGRFREEQIGSGTHVWKFEDMVRAGDMSMREFMDAEACMSRSVGHCMTMGTASTMASMSESLGMALPTNAAILAADSRRNALAHMAGRRIVEMVEEDLTMSKILTREAFENAVRTNGAIGGSTNAVVHLLAVAGRIGVDLSLDDWDTLGRDVPCIVNLMPSGKYLMEDFYYAGGLPAVHRELGEAGFLHKDVPTANGQTLWENVKDAECWNRDVIFALSKPFKERGGIAVLRGNLAPQGAILKPSAATEALCTIAGRRWSSRTSTTTRPESTIRTSPWTRPACWCSRAADRRGIRAFRRPATWGCLRSCSVRASPTWCGFPMRACPAPRSAPWCCTLRRKPRPAAPSRWSGTATRSSSTSPPASSSCTCPTKSSRGAAPLGSRRSLTRSADT